MKKIIALILALVAILSFASCAKKAYEADPKSFTAGNMTIELTEKFEKVDLSGYAAVYATKDAVVYVSNQKASEFKKINGMTLEKYIELFIETNKSKNLGEKKTDGELQFVEYTSVSENVTYKYLTAFFESNGVYVRVEFAAEEQKYEEYRPYFISWAKNVTFESK